MASCCCGSQNCSSAPGSCAQHVLGVVSPLLPTAASLQAGTLQLLNHRNEPNPSLPCALKELRPLAICSHFIQCNLKCVIYKGSAQSPKLAPIADTKMLPSPGRPSWMLRSAERLLHSLTAGLQSTGRSRTEKAGAAGGHLRRNFPAPQMQTVAENSTVRHRSPPAEHRQLPVKG